jgi:putative flippase GtrA
MRHERLAPTARTSRPGLLAWVAGPSELAQVVRFGLIGGISTLIYAIVALLLSSAAGAGLDATPASVAAYLTGAVFSYCGHRVVTFMSDGTVAFEVARFAAATAAGLALSTLLAAALTDLAGLPMWIPVLLASTIVPVLNFIIFRNYVFVGRARVTS